MSSAVETPVNGAYRLIYADPPWQTLSWDGLDRTPTAKKRTPTATDHYPVMSLAALSALPVASWAAPHSVLAMWIVGSHLEQALALARAWGFAYTTDLFYWAKQKLIAAQQIDLFTGDIADAKISLGRYSRKQVEPCLLFKRGRGLRVADHAVRQLIVAPPSQHSRKPAEAAHRLERLFGPLSAPGESPARLEMFARQSRPGWDSWGNEVTKFDAIQILPELARGSRRRCRTATAGPALLGEG